MGRPGGRSDGYDRSAVRVLAGSAVIAVSVLVGALLLSLATASACASLAAAQSFKGTVSTSFSATASGDDNDLGTATASLDRRADLRFDLVDKISGPGGTVFDGNPSGGTVTVTTVQRLKPGWGPVGVTKRQRAAHDWPRVARQRICPWRRL